MTSGKKRIMGGSIKDFLAVWLVAAISEVYDPR